MRWRPSPTRNDGNDDADIEDATVSTYTLVSVDEGNTIKVRVSFTDDSDNQETLTSVATDEVATKPNNPSTGLLTISGTPQVGETLTAETSVIADEDGLDDVSYSYQWMVNDGNDDADIEDATVSTYTLVSADRGKTIKVRVSFTDDRDHAESLTSAATAAVLASVPTDPLSLTVTRGSQIQELDASWQAPASDGGSAITGYKVQWKEAADSWDTAADVSEATVTGTTHTITGLTGGVEYAVRVIATNDVGDGLASTEAKGTPAGGVSEQNTEPTGLPTIGGTPQVGETLTADTSGIADEDGLDDVSYSYQWVAGDTDIDGATGSSYVLTSSEQGKTIKVMVSFTDNANNQETLTSVATVAIIPHSENAEPMAPIWSADMLVVEYTEISIGAATADLFSNIGGTESLQVRSLWSYTPDRDLRLAFTDGVPDAADMTLQVGDLALAFPAGSSGESSFKWTDVDVDWEDGQTIAVGIVPTSTLVDPKPNTAPTGQPTISGTPQVGERLSSDTSAIADVDGLDNVSYTYQWIAGDANIQHATGSSHTLTDDDEGKAIKVKVSFTDDANNAESLTSIPTAAVTPRPNTAATGAPSIQGVLQNSHRVTADTVGITDADGLDDSTFTYQWMRVDAGASAQIDGQTQSSYSLTSDDVGKSIQLQVRFDDDQDNAESLTSAATGLVTASGSTRELIWLAAIAPKVQDGATTVYTYDSLADDVTLSPGAFMADEDTFQTITYLGASPSNATMIAIDLSSRPTTEQTSTWTLVLTDTELPFRNATYATTTADPSAHRFQWDVTELASSTATFPEDDEPLLVSIQKAFNLAATGQPTINGAPQVDETLTADTSGIADGNGLDNVTFQYQWTADGSDIDGATGSSLTLTSSQEGQTIQLQVSFTDDDGFSETTTSQATTAVAAGTAVNNPPTGLPTVSGTPQVEVTLTTDTSAIDDADGLNNVSYRYQWIADGTDIDGATGSTYELTSSEQGQTIQVRVTFTDDRDNAETLTSVATVAVAAAPNREATGAPTVGGTPQVDQTLTADTSAIDDADGLTNVSYGYQWTAGGSDIENATGSSHLLTASEQGQTIQVKVTFTDDADNQESLTSAATLAVTARPNTAATGEPTISGTPQVDQTLTADVSGIDDVDGLTNVSYRYQWTAGGSDIENATGSSHLLTANEQGQTIQVKVTFTDDADNQESLTSAETLAVTAKPNTAATGDPTISGTPQVDETLTAGTSAISDEDGLANVAYQYQWLRDDTDIAGQTSSTYELVAADEGNTIKVRVTFRDDADNAESLTSGATTAVAARPTPAVLLTASFANMPADHNGDNFTFQLTFSENVDAGYARIRNHALTVNGATIDSASRITQGSNQGWTVEVNPTGNDAISITLPETTDCSASGAICTDDSRKLSHPTSAKVEGPPAVSVSDATVQEAEGAVLAFSVTLSHASSRTVTVDYATSDGSAQAGSDYTATSATLTFNAGDTAKAVQVPVLTDSDDEGQETLTLTLSNPSQATLDDATATGTIENGESSSGTQEDPPSEDPPADTPAVTLTAAFGGVPATHNGNLFTFELDFSVNVRSGYGNLRDDAFAVTGGKVDNAQRRTAGTNQYWLITVDPDGNGEVSITLPVTTDCNATGAICDYDDNMLSNSPSAIVAGP